MLSTLVSSYSRPILLLIGSNIFMTLAWYGHLRFKQVPLLGVIVASWAIAFVEYCMAVPANRWGSAVYSTAQLKTMQEGRILDSLSEGAYDLELCDRFRVNR